MKYYLIAGEPSGDLHGANLIKALLKEDPQATVRAWGGDLMQQAGATLAKHYRDLAFMGVWEVVKNLSTIRQNFKFCKEDVVNFQPDYLIFIDYSGFNLRIAKWTKEQGYTNIYYISPQVWATRAKRVHKIKAYIDKMLVILPFEEEFYAKYDYEVTFVGHPLLDLVKTKEKDVNFKTENGLSALPIIALLPGSRQQEIRTMLPIMLGVVEYFPDYQFVIAGAPSQTADFYETLIEQYTNVKLIEGQTYDLLQHSQVALVTSGTATLETALFGVPQIVCYKAGQLMYQIVKRIIQVKYIAIVNLIMGKEIVKELIQKDLNTRQLKENLHLLLEDEITRNNLQKNYQLLYEKLGKEGAAERAAKAIVSLHKNNTETPALDA